MRLLKSWLPMGIACWPGVVGAQLQLVPDVEPKRVFAGEARRITMVWRNDGDQPFVGEIRARILQTSSATVVPVGEAPWKTLQVLPRQTVLESALLGFPAVRGEAKFLVQWLDETNHVMGKTEVLLYSTNLLAELKSMAGEEQAIGVFDPDNVLKPLLESAKVEFADLADTGVGDFHGKLAIIGPFSSRRQMPGDMAARIGKLARNSVAVVWIQPPSSPHDQLKPSFYTVTSGTNAVVIVQADFVANLAEQPQSQLRLLQLARRGAHPEPPGLPESTNQP
jgi:hypothetical protein